LTQKKNFFQVEALFSLLSIVSKEFHKANLLLVRQNLKIEGLKMCDFVTLENEVLQSFSSKIDSILQKQNKNSLFCNQF